MATLATPPNLVLDPVNDILVSSVPELTKALEDARWDGMSPLGKTGNVSVVAANATEKNLTPRQCYELSIAVSKAVGVKARNLSKAKWRAFTRSGEEIVSGPVIQLLTHPAPYLSMRRWMVEMVSWYNIAGEMMADLVESPGGTGLSAMHPLNPYKASIVMPGLPKRREDIRQWLYLHLNGEQQRIRADHLLFETTFNPNDSIRGLSPLVTGSVEVGSGYSAARYRKDYFNNSAIPSHVMVLPDGTSRATRDDVAKRYQSEFGTYNNNAHKVMVVVGSEAKILPLADTPKEGAFMDISRWVVEQVAMLYGVPAIEMGILDKSRFDTAAEERKLFMENTLMPEAEMFSETLQYQVIDRFYTFTANETRKAVFTKSMDATFEQARYDRDSSAVIVLLDTDTLPIMAEVTSGMVEKAEKFKKVFNTSADETANFFGVELPEREERKDVWIDKTLVNITHPEFNEKLNVFTQSATTAKPGGGKEGSASAVGEGKKPDKKPKKKPAAKDKAALKAMDRNVRKLRRLTLEKLDGGELWTLAEADAAMGNDPAMHRPVRLIYHKLTKALRGPEAGADPKAAAKACFNRIKTNTLA